MFPKKKTDVVCRVEEDGYLFYNPETDELHLVSFMGKDIFDMCTGENSANDILSYLALTQPILYGPDSRQLVTNFLKELEKRQLIEGFSRE